MEWVSSVTSKWEWVDLYIFWFCTHALFNSAPAQPPLHWFDILCIHNRISPISTCIHWQSPLWFRFLSVTSLFYLVMSFNHRTHTTQYYSAAPQPQIVTHFTYVPSLLCILWQNNVFLKVVIVYLIWKIIDTFICLVLVYTKPRIKLRT